MLALLLAPWPEPPDRSSPAMFGRSAKAFALRESRRHERLRTRSGGPNPVSQSRGSTAQRDRTSVPAHRQDLPNHIARRDRRVAGLLGVATKLQHAFAAVAGHRHHPVRQHPRRMATQQHIAANDLIGGNRTDRDQLAVADRRIHAEAFGSEPDESSDRQRALDRRTEQVRNHTLEWG
jgi:hypothetical protein